MPLSAFDAQRHSSSLTLSSQASAHPTDEVANALDSNQATSVLAYGLKDSNDRTLALSFCHTLGLSFGLNKLKQRLQRRVLDRLD